MGRARAPRVAAALGLKGPKTSGHDSHMPRLKIFIGAALAGVLLDSCDVVFTRSFQRGYHRLSPHALCCHLGPERLNWGGRATENVTSWGLRPESMECSPSWRAKWVVQF